MEKICFNDLTDIEKQMFDKAKESFKNGYAPYSKFKVGASVLSAAGNIYSGCNVESVDYTLTTHAEMNAIDTMVSNGDRIINKILIFMDTSSEYAVPCGLCRQKILEFSEDDTEIICMHSDGNGHRTSIKELMPYVFKPEHIDED